MKLFLVSPQERSVEAIEALIKEHFGDNYYFRLEKRPFPTWIIATDPLQTTAEIVELLGMREEDKSKCNAGLVVEVGNYRGFDSVDMWEKLDVWTKG